MTDQIVDLDAILAKVAKLLNVKGRSPEEAALYVEQAHAILAKYDLSIASVADLEADVRTAVRQSATVARAATGKPEGWKTDLLESVAAAFECRVFYAYEYEETKSGRLRLVRSGQLVGFGHDVEAAGYAQSFLVGEITRLAKDYARAMWDEIKADAADLGISVHYAESRYVRHHDTHPLKAELFFIKGATQTVGESLRAEARARKDAATRENPNALTIQKSDSIKDFESQRDYGMSWADLRAKREAERAKWATVTVAAKGDTPERLPRPETARARAAREAREARESDRYWRRYQREQAATDHSALRAGQEAGRTIKIRAGVGGGVGEDKRVN